MVLRLGELLGRGLRVDILDLDFREVPQQGGGPMRTSLIGGHLDVIRTNSSETYNLGPDVRALGIFGNERSRLLPDAVEVNAVLAESGIPEPLPEAGALRGLAVPRDFAEGNLEAFARLHDAYRDTVDSEQYRQWLKDTGRDAVTQSMPMDESNETIAAYNQFFAENRDIILGG